MISSPSIIFSSEPVRFISLSKTYTEFVPFQPLVTAARKCPSALSLTEKLSSTVPGRYTAPVGRIAPSAKSTRMTLAPS